MSTTDASPLENLGAADPDLLEIAGNFLKNGKTFREARGLTRENMEALYTLGYNAYNSGQYEQAHRAFQFLCVFDHIERKYWLALGACRQLLKRHAEAVDAYAIASLLDIQDPVPPLRAAECHLALGRRDQAIVALEAVLLAAGDDPAHRETAVRARTMLELLQQAGESAETAP